MELRNKKTGEIMNFDSITDTCFGTKIQMQAKDRYNKPICIYGSLAELNAEWEDYEEPKGSALDLIILTLTNFIVNEPDEDKVDLEDCKQMLEKLKAVRQLKDKGAKITDYDCYGGTDTKGKFSGEVVVTIDIPQDIDKYLFDLLFGGEE